MLKDYGTLILRLGLGIVFLWFGITSLLEPQTWTSLVPTWSPISQTTSVTIMAIFQLIFSILLIIGLFTRLTAILLALSLIPIILSLGYNDVAIRDFGLFTATLSLAVSGSKKLSLDSKLNKRFLY